MTTHERSPGPGPGGQAEEPRQPAPRTHLSAAGLRARGWTPAMVRQLLGDPDLLRSPPHFRSARQTRLYSVERVEAAERSEEFRAASAAAARRSATVERAEPHALDRWKVDHLRHALPAATRSSASCTEAPAP